MFKNINSLEEFCHTYCDHMYTPNLPLENQCTGYIELRNMVLNNINPASLEEINKFERYPNIQELLSKPDTKYLRFLHPILRPFIIEHWDIIKTLKLETI